MLLHDDPSIDKSAVVNSRTIGDFGLLRTAPKKKVDVDGDELEESSDDGAKKIRAEGSGNQGWERLAQVDSDDVVSLINHTH